MSAHLLLGTSGHMATVCKQKLQKDKDVDKECLENYTYVLIGGAAGKKFELKKV